MKCETLRWTCAVLFALSLAFAAVAQPLQLVSTANASLAAAGGGGDSLNPILSADGRYVLFASSANNLVTNSSGNPFPVSSPPALNVYLRDRASGTTTLVSVNLAGTSGDNASSVPRQISTNGQFVLFESCAGDLVAGQSNTWSQVLLRDLAANTTTLISVATNGAAGNGVSRESVMTPDARFVAFVSEANNLTPGDTNRIPDVFVRDTHGGVTTLVSVGAVSTSFSGSAAPVITPDGRWVAFFSSATNLVAGAPADTAVPQNIGEVYVRDMVQGTTVWASSYASNALFALGLTNAISYNQVISDDGQFVAYEAKQRSSPTAPQAAILRYRVADGVTDVIQTNAAGTATGYEAVTRNLDMTPDGRFVAYVANAAGNSGTNTSINVWDAQNGTNIVASTDASGSVPLTAVCDLPMLDSSGRFVAFTCTAALTTNAVIGNALSGPCHLYVRDLEADVPQLVDADPDGVGAMLARATAPSLSADGRFVAFESRDTSLVANDRNHAYDVFLRDLRTNTVELVSVRHPSLPGWSANDASAGSISVSADGSRVAFASDADNLVANDTNGWRDVFVHDLSTGTNLLVSADASNQTSGNGFSSEPAISADGGSVAFSSSAGNLVSGDANNAQDVFIRDLTAQRTELVSINKTGTGPGNASSYAPAVSATGRYVLFRSKATDLATGYYTGENLFLRDRQLGTNYALTTSGVITNAATPDLRYIAYVSSTFYLYVWDSQAGRVIYTNLLATTVSALGISPDGRRIVYAGSSSQLKVLDRIANTNGVVNTAAASPYFPSHIGLQFSTNGQFVAYSMNVGTASSPTNAVYVCDLLWGTNLLVSRSFRPAQLAGGSSDSPAISPDGRFVAYRSVATNIVAAASNGVANLLLYDSLSGTNTLLTAGRYGSVATDAPALSPTFSAGGATLVFCSWAWDLAPNDFNAGADAFAYDLSGLINAFAIQIIPPAASGDPWTITWAVSPGRNYAVEYKDDLREPEWHDLGSPITILGSQASATDPVLTTARFYRVLSF